MPPIDVRPEAIKRYADFQINWSSVIQPLRRGRYTVESTEARSIHGDAPKNFLRIKEFIPGRSNERVRHWIGYIAKVGSKRYPVESITEHLLTRIGQEFGVIIADSQLRMVAGQVRYLSKYFLSLRESLVHGLEIFRRHLDDEMVEQIAAARQEQDFYTFQTVLAAIKDIFPDHLDTIMDGVVEMLAFDAMVGNNDRHPLNWGVIVPLAKNRPIRFAPIFDSARGMFWNLDDRQLAKFVQSEDSMRAYICKSFPQIGWDNYSKINHFELIRFIYRNYPNYRKNLDKFAAPEWLPVCGRMVEGEFGRLMSDVRRNAICKCLRARHDLYREAACL